MSLTHLTAFFHYLMFVSVYTELDCVCVWGGIFVFLCGQNTVITWTWESDPVLNVTNVTTPVMLLICWCTKDEYNIYIFIET